MTWSQRAFLELAVPPTLRPSTVFGPSSSRRDYQDSRSYRLFRFIDHRDPRYSHLLSLPQPLPHHHDGSSDGDGGEWCRHGSSSSSSSSKKNVAVVYVPGHVGSYQQARSLGAHGIQLTRYDYAPSQQALVWRNLASHRWNGTARRLSHFVYDVYTVDFQEEPTALHGAFVRAQAAFVQRVIQHLSSCQEVSQIIIVAHSMAGYVAQLALSDEFELLSVPWPPNASTTRTTTAARVRNLITLGTPHAHPVLAWDVTLYQIHQQLRAIRQKQERGDDDTDLALISISGGIRDEMIPPNACDMTTITTRYHRPTKNALTLLATDIMTPRKESKTTATTSKESFVLPTAYHQDGLGMDHRAIVWCHNLLRPLRGIIHALAVPQTTTNGDATSGADVEFLAEHRVNQVRTFISSQKRNASFHEEEDEDDEEGGNVYATAVKRQKRRFQVSLRSFNIPSFGWQFVRSWLTHVYLVPVGFGSTFLVHCAPLPWKQLCFTIRNGSSTTFLVLRLGIASCLPSF